MRNNFYFTLKALFFLKIFESLSWFFGYVGKQLDKKAQANFKSMMSKTWKQITQCSYWPTYQEVMAIRWCNCVSLENITWEMFFLKNHTQNVVGILVPGPFLKNQNWTSLNHQSKHLCRLFILNIQVWGLSKYIKLRCWPIAFVVSLPNFLHDF